MLQSVCSCETSAPQGNLVQQPLDPMTFSDFKLAQPIMEAVQALGFTEPTPVQAQAIPLMMENRDVIGSAQTGTGKTAAFGLPILTHLGKRVPGGPRALILVPTRELALQVSEAIIVFAQFTDLRVSVFYGGVGYGKQLAALREGTDVIVATPGRLLDHLSRGALKLNSIRYLVLDEADRMLDMGFLPDVRKIINQVPRQRQTSLFSATIPSEIESLIKWMMDSPVVIQIGARYSPADTVNHWLFPVAASQKPELLKALLRKAAYESAIVFCRTKHGADRVGRLLKASQHRVAVLHSNFSQRERDQALAGFRDGRFKVLVATDIAARGLDVADVSHVINYDVPQHPEDYVHRIGRTGRAQSKGEAMTIMAAEDTQHVRAIERLIGRGIPREKVEDFSYEYTRLFDEGKKGPQAQPSGRVRGVRLSGGYYFGHVKSRR